VRDAYASPHRVGVATAATFALVVLVEALGATDLSRLAGPMRISAVLMVLGSGLLTYGLLAVWTRRSLEPWMRAYTAENLAVERALGTGITLMREVGLSVSAVALMLWAAAVMALPDEARTSSLSLVTIVGALLWLVVIIAAARWAFARGKRFDEDIAALRRRIDGYGERLGSGLEAVEEGFEVSGDEGAVVRLSGELHELTGRFSVTQTAEVMARQGVQELQQKKMLFMASMSHDLRAPLNSILGFAELLSSDSEEELNEAQRQSVETIRQSGAELLRLLNDVLDSARFQAGRLELRREWTPLVEILMDAVGQGRAMIEGRNLKIVTELQPGLPPIHVDRDRIVQAVVGLFGHAVRAMEEGTIRLRANVADGPDGPASQVRVAVVDSSAGIRAEDRERIFQAFREVADPSGRRIGGLGLGLSLARALVTAHGGDIWCESRAHEGTTLTAALPISGPKPQESPRKPRQSGRIRRSARSH